MKIKVSGANLSGLNENVDIGHIISPKKKKKHNVVEVESITKPEPPLKSIKKSKKLYKQPDQDFPLRETNTVEPETKLEESIMIKKKKRHNELKEFEDSAYIASNESITMFNDSNVVNINESSKKKKGHKKDFQGTELYQNQCAEGTKPKSKHNSKQKYIALLSVSDCENSLNRKKGKSENVHGEGIFEIENRSTSEEIQNSSEDILVKSKSKKKCLEYPIDMTSEQTEDLILSKSKRKKKCLEYSIDTTPEQTEDLLLQSKQKKKCLEYSVDTFEQTEYLLSKSKQNKKKKKSVEHLIDTASEQTEDLLSKSKQNEKKKKCLEYSIDTSEQTEDLLSKSKQNKKKKKSVEHSIDTASEQTEDLLSKSKQKEKKKKCIEYSIDTSEQTEDLLSKSKQNEKKKICLEYSIDTSEQIGDLLSKSKQNKKKKKSVEHSIDTASEQTEDLLSKSKQNEKKKKCIEYSIDTSEQTEDLLSKSKQNEKKKKCLEYAIDTSEQTKDLLSKSKQKKKKKKCSEYSINTTSEQTEDLLSISEQKKKGSNDLEGSQSKESNDLLGYQEKTSPKRSVTFDGSVIDNEPESSPKKMKRKDLKKLEEDMAYQPTEEEIEESLKTENKKVTVSKRKIKRDKLKHKQEEERVNSELSMQQRGISYLSLWKHNRNEWKFEKLRQVWLIHNMLSEQKIPEKNWETLLEYMSAAKGQVRKTIIESAMKVIQETELWSERKQEAQDKDEEIEEPQPCQLKYRRARELLQCLQE